MNIRYGICLCFLGMNALADSLTMEILLLPSCVLGLAAAAADLFCGGFLSDLLPGCLPGLGILAVSLFSGEQVGKGDAVIVLIMGILIGGEETLRILTAAVLLSGIFVLFLLLFTEKQKAGKREFPFVPFLFLAACFCAALA